ncbi:DUF2478 domain-containing protein [Tropicimonas aquimaris]|uniref:DUF2478 domain-containing protein n=1 Tax=Tropicimonas aquimaris TaxID=914152 RepID=A0ABW3IT52_9RHOB
MKLAYTMSDVPGRMNATLNWLASALQAEGMRPVGAVQINRDADTGSKCAMDLLILPDGPRVCISQTLGPGASGCRLDTGSLELSVQRAAERLAEGADVFIANKFGKHEGDGRGFRDLIATALMQDVPAVVGTTAANLPAFLDFAGGLAEEVACDGDTLLSWCRDARK